MSGKSNSDNEMNRNLISENSSDSINFSTSVFIPDEVIDASLNEWIFSLIGRLNLVNLKLSVAEENLRKQRTLKGNCQFIPIGKGLFIFKLDNGDDMKYICEGYWDIKSQALRLRFWERDFKPELQKSSNAFVWITFPDLSIEYWKEAILMAMGNAIGRPIRIDEITLQKEIGYYASILVEVDLTNVVPNKVWVESKYGKFEQEVRASKIPKFCIHCKTIGHNVAECRTYRKGKTQEVAPKQQKWGYTPKKIQQHSVIGFDICNTPANEGTSQSHEIEEGEIVIPNDNQNKIQEKVVDFTFKNSAQNDIGYQQTCQREYH
ncbi:uncharacterized protein LOC113333631 [Papaver somniferum]|uniref:uncharacterized protein LOC113333631 n=1 Tax=Papaver somniferum TaxID=3469 RepID=UPI000E700E4C|nr:uncharacterized protein LOC113333631 [Papaver somniferum]